MGSLFRKKYFTITEDFGGSIDFVTLLVDLTNKQTII